MKNLSTKELNYINDLLSWELLAAKKCAQYANQETNPVHKNVFSSTGNMHQQNYTNVLSYVDQFMKNHGGQMQ
jgi:hypothetical protein